MKTSSLLLTTALAAVLFPLSTARAAEKFAWVNLTSDIHGVANNTDENSVNPWGIVPGADGRLWVANADSGTITIYKQTGELQGPVIDVPPPGGSQVGATGHATGLILNHAAFGLNPDFNITKSQQALPAQYLTCTEDGVIAGYNYTLDANDAIVAVDHSADGAVYKGLALSRTSTGDHKLYVANFSQEKIEVYNDDFTPDITLTTKLNASDLNPVAGFAPFNIKHYATPDHVAHKLKRYIIVAYAKHIQGSREDIAGAGNGYINVFDSDGNFVKRLVDYSVNTPNELNSPWGMAIAHGSFAKRGTNLLVGNFGDGKIHRYRLANFLGTPEGALKDTKGNELQFDGLWGMHFGRRHRSLAQLANDNDDLGESEVVLYFTAGIADEAHGLVGRIVPR